MYRAEEVLRQTRPYQVPLYEDKVIHEILKEATIKATGHRFMVYEFDDGSIIVDFDGHYKAYPEPSDQKPHSQPCELYYGIIEVRKAQVKHYQHIANIGGGIQ